MKINYAITRRLISVSLLFIFVLGFTTQPFGQKIAYQGAPQSPLASVTPVPVGSNPNCTDLNADNAQFPAITTDFEFKIDSQFSHGGPFPFQSGGNKFLVGPPDPANSVTTSGTSTTIGQFTSTKAISAVIVKSAGQTSNVYYYPAGIFTDTNLVTLTGQEISHVTFCYFQPATVTIIKEVATPSGTATQMFAFTETNLGTGGFSLQDQNVVGPDRKTVNNLYKFSNVPGNTITVTETVTLGWTLLEVTCVETAGGGLPGNPLPNQQNSSGSIVTGAATINLEQGETVVCTFRNGRLTPSAGEASVSGRVATSVGRGISGATIKVWNVTTGKIEYARTNVFGYFVVDDLPAADFYFISVSHKRYLFDNAQRSFTLNDNVAGLDFVASP